MFTPNLIKKYYLFGLMNFIIVAKPGSIKALGHEGTDVIFIS